MQPNKSGYIGILALLVGVSVMIFIYTKVYFTPTPNKNSTAPATTQYDSLIGNIDSAKAIADIQNINALEANKVLNAI